MNELQHIAQIAQLLSDETRLRILTLLFERDATVNDLVTALDVDQPRVSSHLSRLSSAGLIEVEKSGRQRIYRVANPAQLESILSAITQFGSTQLTPPSASSNQQVQQNTTVRQARTCYDHLGGIAGVFLLDEMLKQGWLSVEKDGNRPHYTLTEIGQTALIERGIDVNQLTQSNSRRIFAYGCPDWTERQPHLGGLLGAAIFTQLLNDGFIEESDEGRAVIVVEPLTTWFE